MPWLLDRLIDVDVLIETILTTLIKAPSYATITALLPTKNFDEYLIRLNEFTLA